MLFLVGSNFIGERRSGDGLGLPGARVVRRVGEPGTRSLGCNTLEEDGLELLIALDEGLFTWVPVDCGAPRRVDSNADGVEADNRYCCSVRALTLVPPMPPDANRRIKSGVVDCDKVGVWKRCCISC